MIPKNLFIRNLAALLTIYAKLFFNLFKIGNVSNISKRRFIATRSAKFGINVIVETGTYFGHSTIYFSKRFKKVYTIEISEKLFQFVTKKFSKCKNIDNFLGDSSVVIKEVLNKLDSPAVFFLDGHASGGVTESGDKASPIREELISLATFKHLTSSIIFIDDAIGFDGTNSYPSYKELVNWCIENKLEVPKIELDMLTIYPRS
jgi:hypothetical protein